MEIAEDVIKKENSRPNGDQAWVCGFFHKNIFQQIWRGFMLNFFPITLNWFSDYFRQDIQNREETSIKVIDTYRKWEKVTSKECESNFQKSFFIYKESLIANLSD